MIHHLLNKYGIKQVGYYVENLEEAARNFPPIESSNPARA